MGAVDGSSTSSVIDNWGVEVLSRSDTRLLMKLSLAGMNGLGASCRAAEGESSVFRGGAGVSAAPKGTTEGASASRTGVSVVLVCGSV